MRIERTMILKRKERFPKGLQLLTLVCKHCLVALLLVSQTLEVLMVEVEFPVILASDQGIDPGKEAAFQE